MKNLLKLIAVAFIAIAVYAFLTVGASMLDAGEYTVSTSEDGYLLSSGTEEIARGEDLTLLLSSLPTGARVCFDGIETDELITLRSGEYIFSGSIRFLRGGGILVDGASICHSGLSLSLDGGCVRIRRGAYTVSSGYIISNGVGITLDGFASSRFVMTGGSVRAASYALYLEDGSARILGGSLSSIGEAAVYSSSELVLAGDPSISGWEYGVASTSPIILYDGDLTFSSRLSVLYLGEVEKGGLDPIVYATRAEDTYGITVFSKGTAVKCTWREGCLFAWDPYKISLFVDGELYGTCEFAVGDAVCPPSAPERLGYTFSGWYTRDGVPFDFGALTLSDVTLYAGYTLTAPSFSLSSESFVYDSEERLVSVGGLSHPLLDEGTISFVWYKDGVRLSSYSSTHSVRSVCDSGEYYAKITFTVGTDTVSVDTPRVYVNISRALIPLPSLESAVYTGAPQSPEIPYTELYTVSRCVGKDVGAYPVTVTLKDPENYGFVGVDGESATLYFMIERAENRWLSTLSVSDVYSNGIPMPKAVAQYGEVIYLFSVFGSGEYTDAIPHLAGRYSVRAIVLGTDNYTSLESGIASFFIKAEEVVGISVKTPPSQLDYLAFDSFSAEGLVIEAVYNSGRRADITSDLFEVSYQTADSLRYGDGGVIISYGGKSVVQVVNVERREYDLSSVEFSSVSIVYSSSYMTLSMPTVMPYGLDGIALEGHLEGGGTDVGSYTVFLVFESKSQNYHTPTPISATLTVTPLRRELIWQTGEFTYDGGLKCPSAYYLDVLGRRVSVSVSGGRTLAGKYMAEAAASNENYFLTNTTKEYVIKKAEYDMSGVLWIGGGEIYDGKEKSVNLINLPEGVEVIGYANARGVDAGSYVAKATLSYDEANYLPPAVPEYEWHILRGEYDLSSFDFSDTEVTFDGALHYPTLIGNLPVGFDGIELEYSFSEGVRDVSAGRRAVTVSFYSLSKNYIIPDSITRYVTISPKGIYVVWQGDSFVYCGDALSPSSTASECHITVSGGGVDAGEYVAYATSSDPNFYAVNSRFDFVILKADNAWREPITVGDIFFGDQPRPVAHPIAGAVEFMYYASSDTDTPLDGAPSAVGSYYLLAKCNGDKNHNPIESELIPFRIMEVVTVGIRAELNKTHFYAMQMISNSDLTVYLVYNNGKEEALQFSDLLIAYPTEDGFRVGDRYFTVDYLDYSLSLGVSVERATLDLSGVSWGGATVVYDGNAHTPYLIGLPEGVNVVEYIGGGCISAGAYTVSAVISYDEENYYPITVSDCRFVIEKRVLQLPSIPYAIYCGKECYPSFRDSELYTSSFSGGAVHAGVYPITLSVNDPNNYTFSGGVVVTLDFTVLPRPLTVKVDDADTYLFDREISYAYAVTDGEIIGGDTLDVSYIVRDGMIYLFSGNPDYALTVEAGRLTEHFGLSPKMSRALVIVFILLLILTLVVILILRYRVTLLFALRQNVRTAARDITPQPPKGDDEAVSGAHLDAVSLEYADSAISDSLARDLIRREEDVVTGGRCRSIVNVDTLSDSFSSGERVDINILKRKSLIPYDTAYIKVLARGAIDKPLSVYANDFSLAAVKMIALAGGRAVKVGTHRENKRAKNEESS